MGRFYDYRAIKAEVDEFRMTGSAADRRRASTPQSELRAAPAAERLSSLLMTRRTTDLLLTHTHRLAIARMVGVMKRRSTTRLTTSRRPPTAPLRSTSTSGWRQKAPRQKREMSRAEQMPQRFAKLIRLGLYLQKFLRTSR